MFVIMFPQTEMVAGTPGAIRMWIPQAGYYVEGMSDQLAVEVDNQAGFIAGDFEVMYTATHVASGIKKFTYTKPKFVFPANTKQWVSTLPQTWTPDLAGEYFIEATFTSPDDQTPNDNYCWANVSVLPGGLSYNGAKSILLGQLPNYYPYLDLTCAWLKEDPLQPGDVVESYDSREVQFTATEECYFGFADWNKDAVYDHPTGFFTISKKDSGVTYYSANWWPEINGQVYPSEEDSSKQNDIVFGTPQTPSQVPDSSIHMSTTGVHKDSVCALLVSGPPKDREQGLSHDFNLETMKGNLTRESFGPRLDESNIRTLRSASKQQVCDVLDSMKNKYKTIYFYYGGHGGRYSMATDDPDSVFFWYSELARKLSDTKADTLNVIIDACHAGQAAIDFKQNDYLFAEQNVTLLTSCRADTVSWYRYSTLPNGDTMRTMEFTWAFALCFGQPLADNNGDGQTSYIETMAWIYKQNPKLDVAGYMNERMDPVVWVHRYEPAVSTGSSAPDIGVDIQPDTTKQDGGEYKFTFTSGVDLGTFIDPKILTVYNDYAWDIEPEDVDTTGKVTLTLDYSAWTYKSKLELRIGLVKRDSTDDDWEIYRPAVVDTTKKTVTATGVDDFSQWALAHIANSAPLSASAAIITDEDVDSPPVSPIVNDPDAGDGHIITIESQPTNGTATVTGNRLVYSPDKDYSGADSFTFSAEDPDGVSVVGTASVSVRPRNDQPVAVDDNATTNQNVEASIDVLTNDSDVDGDAITVLSTTNPPNGSASIQVDNTITYTPDTDFFGGDSFEYTVIDDSGAVATATVQVTVNEVTPDNKAPIAVNDSVITNEDTPIVIPVMDNDSDPDGDNITLISMEGAQHGSTIMIPDNVIQYTPSENYNGEDSFTYRIQDAKGAEAQATVFVNILAVNDAPESFTRTLPVDASTVSTSAVMFEWTAAVDPESDPVNYALRIQVASIDTTITSSNTSEVVDFAAMQLPATMHTVQWSLVASDGLLLTDAANGDGSFTLDISTGVEGISKGLLSFALAQNYPNPFGGSGARIAESTTISYSVYKSGFVSLSLHDIMGRRVRTVVNERKDPGTHRYTLPASGLKPGVYFYRMQFAGTQLWRKMILLQ
jgi:Big-like domain-containing protein/caspase domain-containing protein